MGTELFGPLVRIFYVRIALAVAAALLLSPVSAQPQADQTPRSDAQLRQEVGSDRRKLAELRQAEKLEIKELNSEERSELSASAAGKSDADANAAARLIRAKYKAKRKDVRMRYKPQRDRLQEELKADRARRKALHARP